MFTVGMIKVSAGCPTFDGTDYPYWKNKMCMHLEAIDNDLWYVVKNGVPSITPTINAADVKRFKQLDLRESWTRGCPDSRTIIIGRTPRL